MVIVRKPILMQKAYEHEEEVTGFNFVKPLKIVVEYTKGQWKCRAADLPMFALGKTQEEAVLEVVMYLLQWRLDLCDEELEQNYSEELAKKIKEYF